MVKNEIFMNIRKATLDDAAALCNIYNYYIENTAITHETVILSVDDAKQKISEAISIYVGEIDGKIAGFYTTYPWINYGAYKTTVEASMFLDRDETGKGYGTQLFEHLLKNIDKTKTHVLLAIVAIPNEASVRLLEKFGFKQVSHLKEVGRKFDKWRDIGHWQLMLNF